MTPDVKTRDYYLNFIANAKKDIETYTKELEYYQNAKVKQLEAVFNHKEEYEDKFKIYVDNEVVAIKRAIYLNKTEEDRHNKFLLILLIRVGHTNNKIVEYENMIRLAKKRTSMKFKEFEEHVSRYYNKVHKYVLQGFGYKYGFGIGTLCINRWKVRSNGKLMLDYNATNARRKELIALGKKLYNKREKEWYDTRGIPYDGIDYRVYCRDDYKYMIEIIKSKLFNYSNHNFKHTEYVNNKFKGMSYTAIAGICDNLDDIANLPVDLRYKLNIYLYKEPANYINFIRNNEQDRYKYGAHNS